MKMPLIYSLSSVVLLLTLHMNNAFVPLQQHKQQQQQQRHLTSSSTSTTSSIIFMSAENTGEEETKTKKDSAASEGTSPFDGPVVMQVGDVMPLKRPGSSSDAASSFGEVVPLKRPGAVDEPLAAASTTTTTTAVVDPAQVKRRNAGVAALSICLAVANYAWQWAHPIEPIQLLFTMEQNSAPVTAIGSNSKPTVVDFWAPWCENCKFMAPTLLQIEEEYKDRVNFVMVNGDAPEAWPLIEAFGVDAIPHMALVEADGTVDTALIGPVPKRWLASDLDVLIENAAAVNSDREQQQQQQAMSVVVQNSRKTLPFQMLDVFANRPEQRRIVVSPVSSSSAVSE